MKKYAAIALVIFFLTLLSVFLADGNINKEPEPAPVKKSKKTVQISEISPEIYSIENLNGNWILFLHYTNETSSVDITIDSLGSVTSKDKKIIGNLNITVDENGSVEMNNEHAQFKGTLNKEENHIDGMVVMQESRTPVPFSAFKIEDTPVTK